MLAPAQQSPKLVHRQRAQVEPSERHHRSEADRFHDAWCDPGRRDDRHRLIDETSEREPESAGRRPVRPLDVVDRDHDRPSNGKASKRGQRPERHGARVESRALDGSLEEEGRLQRPALRSGKLIPDLVQRRPEQIREDGEGELDLDLRTRAT